jgi:hypothetical protein
MSSFCDALCQGHIEHLKHVCGYLKGTDGAICFRVGVPDHESHNIPQQYDWIKSVYGHNQEELHPICLSKKGKPMHTITNEDANLVDCFVTRPSMSGIIQLLNQTPFQWFCKKHNEVETATYGS